MKAALLFFLILSVFNAVAQTDSLPPAAGNAMVVSSDSSLQTRPGAGIVRSSIPFLLMEMKARHRAWSDQFPSPMVAYFNGIEIIPPPELPIERKNEDWKFWLALGLLAFLAAIRFAYPQDVAAQLDALRNWGLNQQVLREIGLGIPFGVVLLNVFSAGSVGFYIFLLIEYYHWVHVEPSWLVMMGALVMVITFLLGRYLLLKGAEIISTTGKEIKLYLYYELEVYRLAGLVLFPVTLLIGFGREPLNAIGLYASFIFVAALLMMRFAKSFYLGFTYFGNHVIHFLLYICALEIAPILIVIRLLSELNSVRFAL